MAATTLPAPPRFSPLAEALFGTWSGSDSAAARARAALASTLLANGPRPELAAQLALFGQFVGSWDLDVVSYPESGPPRRESGEWHFGWALDGRAVIDVWISPDRDHRFARPDAGDFGATLRFFDPALAAWQSTWIGPIRGVVRPFIGRRVGEEIVLEGSFSPGIETRWVFSRITAHGFHWRSVQTTDGWASQRLTQEMHATRQSAGDLAEVEPRQDCP